MTTFKSSMNLTKTFGRGNVSLPLFSIIAISIVSIVFGQEPAIIYILFIAGSLIFGYALNVYNNHPKTCLLLTLLLVTYLTIFIGLRDFGVGTDTMVYVDMYWDWGNYVHSIRDFSNFDYVSNAFLLLSVIGHIISNDHQILLFLTALTINLSTFIALYIANYKELRINWIIYIFIWQFLFMNTSMNAMRQDCAQGFALLSVVLFFKRKWIYALICFFIAYEFHSTVLILLPIVGCYYLDMFCGPKKRNVYTIIGLLFLVAVMFSIFKYLDWFISNGYINDHFDTYTDNSHFEGGNLFGVSYIAMTVLYIYVCVYLRKRNLISDSSNYLLITLYGLSFVLRLSAYSLVYVSRLSAYYNYISFFALAFLLTRFSKKIPLLIQSMLYIIILYTWFVGPILVGTDETYPYHSVILGI